jgi:hypothetical protein
MSLPGSLAEPDAVMANPISLELRSALEILCHEASRKGVTVTCAARPELFTHGMSEAWFRERVIPPARHVCLSDGSAVKHLPGLPTYAFFYALSFNAATSALRKLASRAPELMANLQGQVNSWVTVGNGTSRVRPPPVFLSRAMPLEHPPSTLLPFFLNRDSAEDSANRMEQAGPVDIDTRAGATRLMYVPLTETALVCRSFACAISDLILRACFRPSMLLVLRIPGIATEEPSLAQSIAIVLAAVRASGVLLPRASPPNVLFATRDLEEAHPIFDRLPLHVVVHESFDFWRYTKEFYDRADQITIVAEFRSCADEVFLPYEVSAIYGARAVRRWVVDPIGGD